MGLDPVPALFTSYYLNELININILHTDVMKDQQ